MGFFFFYPKVKILLDLPFRNVCNKHEQPGSICVGKKKKANAESLLFNQSALRDNPKTFALPARFTQRPLAPAVHLPAQRRPRLLPALCFDQVEANHWCVEQEAGGMA